MYYSNLYEIISGINNDNIEIMHSINRMSSTTSHPNATHPENKVILKHDGNLLHYVLVQDEIRIEGNISFEKLFRQTRGKRDIELDNAICDIIEEDAINRYFQLS